MTKMGDEKLWPMSMPCFVSDEDKSHLPSTVHRNIGRIKNLYRQGLKHRYGSLMQIISGVHFNFSFPRKYIGIAYMVNKTNSKERILNRSYFALIRNYYRYGWIIPYLFGVSPALCPSILTRPRNSARFSEDW